MTLRIHNTLSKQKELFNPIVAGRVGIYLCGPTVYKPAHIGHAVGPVIFDVVKRYLTYKGFQVNWVVNITDVDDKIITEAAARGVSVTQLARELEQQYVDALAALDVTSIDAMPRASEYVPQMIEHIQGLIDRGYAYVVDGDVYFDVGKDDDYGKLSNRKPEEQFAGTRDGLLGKGKRNPGDFALWKAAKPSEPDDVKFPSPWGPGRPGWHIECSVMSARLLGETFDIHGGGMDLIFPHHENEIAQSESLTDKPFARIWMHNGLTRFNTKKISKSDAEMQKAMQELQLTNLLAKYPSELLRFLILSSHYRAPIDFSDSTIDAARKGLDTFYRLFERIERLTGSNPYEAGVRIEQLFEVATDPSAHALVKDVLAEQLRFLEAMDDDFNTAAAIGVLFDIAGLINRYIEQSRLEIRRSEQPRTFAAAATHTLVFLGRLLGMFLRPAKKQSPGDDALSGDLIALLIDVRNQARQTRQFEIGDLIRNRLDALGILLEDRPDGTGWRRK
ncbi:MAG: cysteine--tRNA ligase [Phycisphaerae bacterium]|nr:cysteine--tRNA ligase [Phycisphaerae bacterium]